MKALRVRAALALGAIVCVGVGGTYAYWSDSVPVSGVTITSGTLDLKVNNADSITNYSGLNLTNMVPGNSTAAVLTVQNAGNVPLTYYADGSATGPLGAALVVKITGDTSVTGSGSSATCAGTALANSGTSFSSNLIGSSANPRTLAAGASESICVQATLPSTASSSLQGTTTNIALTFNANQVQ